MATEIEIKDNSIEFLHELGDRKPEILEKIGLLAEGYAKMLCPVDTGRLRNSISHTQDESAAYIGTNVEYAPYVEMGTTRTRAQPYIRPAIENHKSEYQDIAKKALEGN